MQAHSIFSQNNVSEVSPLLSRDRLESAVESAVNSESSDILKEIDDVLSILESHLMTEDMIVTRERCHVGMNIAIFTVIVALLSILVLITLEIFNSISDNLIQMHDYDAAKNGSDAPALKSNAEQSYNHMRLWLGLGIPGLVIFGATSIAMACLCGKLWEKHKTNERNVNLLKPNLSDTEFQQVRDMAAKIGIPVEDAYNIKNLIDILKEKKSQYEFEKNKSTIGLAKSVKKLLPAFFGPAELEGAEVIEVAAEPASLDPSCRV